MDRRALLRNVGAAGAAVLAGCSAVADPVRLTDGAVERDDGDSYVVYRRGDDRLLTFGVRTPERPADAGRFHPFELTVPHAARLTVESLRVRFGTDATPQGVPPEMYLRRPTGHPYPEVEFGRTSDGDWVVFALPETGIQGESTLAVGFLLAAPRGTIVDVDGRVELAGEGSFARRYVAEPRLSVRL